MRAARGAGPASEVERRALLRAYRENGDLAARDRLVEGFMPLVSSLARRYAGRGEQLEDLEQVASLGLMKAIERFDLDREVDLVTYIFPTVVGELKRHFRDRVWSVTVPRRLKELYQLLSRLLDELTAKNGRQPTIPELAEAAGVTEEEVVEALEAGRAYAARSLTAPGHARRVRGRADRPARGRGARLRGGREPRAARGGPAARSTSASGGSSSCASSTASRSRRSRPRSACRRCTCRACSGARSRSSERRSKHRERKGPHPRRGAGHRRAPHGARPGEPRARAARAHRRRRGRGRAGRRRRRAQARRDRGVHERDPPRLRRLRPRASSSSATGSAPRRSRSRSRTTATGFDPGRPGGRRRNGDGQGMGLMIIRAITNDVQIESDPAPGSRDLRLVQAPRASRLSASSSPRRAPLPPRDGGSPPRASDRSRRSGRAA